MRRLIIWLWMIGWSFILLACAPTPKPILTPTTVVTPAAEVMTPPVSTNYCLDCHSDKEALIQTAKPEEKAPSESEGVG